MDIQHAKQSNTNCNFITKIIVASVSDGAQTLGQDWWLLLLATLLWYAQAGTLPALLYFNLTEYRLVQAHPVVFKEF